MMIHVQRITPIIKCFKTLMLTSSLCDYAYVIIHNHLHNYFVMHTYL